MKRVFEYRFAPTGEQAAELPRAFGYVRLVCDKALAEHTRAWRTEWRRVSYGQSSAALTEWKKTPEPAFLDEVSFVPLRQALRHLPTAVTGFFAGRARCPRFKSRKKSRTSAECTAGAFRWRDGRLTLAELSEPPAIMWSRPPPDGAQPSTVTVSRDAAGRRFCSVPCTGTITRLASVEAPVGVDAGITSLVKLSTGEKITNPRHERPDQERLAKAHKALARKAKGSADRGEARARVARIHARIADRHSDFLHKPPTRLVHENHGVVIEDLHLAGMVADHSLARAVSDAARRKLRTMPESKAGRHGRELVVADR